MPPSLKHRPSLSSTLLQCIALYQQNSGSVEVNWHRCCTKESIFLHQSPWANPGDEGDVLGALKDAERFDYQPLLRQRSTLESMMKIIKGIHIRILKKSYLSCFGVQLFDLLIQTRQVNTHFVQDLYLLLVSPNHLSTNVQNFHPIGISPEQI